MDVALRPARIALVGNPNAGKSALFNALVQREAAIVTPIAGTTRDVLRETIRIDGVELTLVDTAGLRETDDRIEQEGIRRSWSAVDKAELVLYLVDDRHDDRPGTAGRARPYLSWSSV